MTAPHLSRSKKIEEYWLVLFITSLTNNQTYIMEIQRFLAICNRNKDVLFSAFASKVPFAKTCIFVDLNSYYDFDAKTKKTSMILTSDSSIPMFMKPHLILEIDFILHDGRDFWLQLDTSFLKNEKFTVMHPQRPSSPTPVSLIAIIDSIFAEWINAQLSQFRSEKRMKILKEDLIAAAWAPRRVEAWLDSGVDLLAF